jgi:putative ABC transport system permease protein
VLSSFRPAAVLRGGVIRATGSPIARASLVAIQFAVLIGLIVTTTTIYRQTRFALGQGMGAADSERILDVFSCDPAFVAEVRKLPGVGTAACSTMHGLNLVKLAQRVHFKGGGQGEFDVAPIDAGLLEVYGVKPLAGRLFSREHGEDGVLADTKTKAQPTVVLNETAARRLGFSDPRTAVGQTMTWTRDLWPGGTPVTGPSLIVGVVPDLTVNVRSAVVPTFYFEAPKDVGVLSIRLVGRDIAPTVKAIDGLIKKIGQDRPAQQMFWSQYRTGLYRDLTVQGETIAICAGLAILIACLGLFGLAAFMTERRTKEIGIRKAMGASTRDVVLLLLWQFTLPVLCAVALALPVGFWAMSGWLHQFAYRVPLSAWTFALAGAAAVAIAWLTVTYQSYAVARAKPAGALQYE